MIISQPLDKKNFTVDRKKKNFDVYIFVDTETVQKHVEPNSIYRNQFVLGFYQIIIYRNGKQSAIVEESFFNHPAEFSLVMQREAEFKRVDYAYDVTVMAHNWNFDGTELHIGDPAYQKQFGYTVDLSNSIFYDPVNNGMLPYFLSLNFPECNTKRYCKPGGKKKEYYCHFNLLDSMNFFPKTKLEKLGDSLGIKKPPLPQDSGEVDYDQFIEDPDRCRKLLMNRCKQDVVILAESIKQLNEFTRTQFGTSPIITIGRLAFSSFACSPEYKNSLMIKSVKDSKSIEYIRPIAPDDRRALKVLSKSYKGGRTDCFYNGVPFNVPKLYKYDINSMYPHLMKSFAVPIRFLGHTRSPKHINLLIDKANTKYKDMYNYMICVDLNIPNTEDNRYSFEGVHLEGKGLCFCVGKHKYVWLWKEQHEYAKSKGWIYKTREIHMYNCHNIFADYIDRLYKLRQYYKNEEPNAIFEKFCKLMMNSLYGRFGMKGSGNWLVCEDEDFLKSDKQGKNMITRFVGKDKRHYHLCEDGIWYEYSESEILYNKNSVPQIAHYICAMGRLMLTKAFEEVRLRGGNVYYCDTDSMIIDIKIDHSDELGGWGYEGEQKGEDCFFAAPKHYMFGLDDMKIKGVKTERLGRINITDTDFPQEQFSKHIQLLKRNRVHEGGYIREFRKRVLGTNNKRKEMEDWGFNSPIVLK